MSTRLIDKKNEAFGESSKQTQFGEIVVRENSYLDTRSEIQTHTTFVGDSVYRVNFLCILSKTEML